MLGYHFFFFFCCWTTYSFNLENIVLQIPDSVTVNQISCQTYIFFRFENCHVDWNLAMHKLANFKEGYLLFFYQFWKKINIWIYKGRFISGTSDCFYRNTVFSVYVHAIGIWSVGLSIITLISNVYLYFLCLVLKYLFFFAEAFAEIDGPSEKFIKTGSALVLNCTFKRLTEKPAYVFW